MIFTIYGTDSHRVNEKLRELKSGFIQKRDKAGLNVVKLDGEDLTLARLEQEALTTPFLSEKKMIIVSNLLSDKKLGKEVAKFLSENNQRIDNILCFVDCIDPEKAKVDKKNKLSITGDLFKYLTSQEYTWEFNLLASRELEQWLKKYINEQKINIEPKAISELIIRTGNDLVQIMSELQKLTALKLDAIITVADIKLMVNPKFDDNIFNLVDALGSKNKNQAIKLISSQLQFGSHPLIILSMIARQFKIILKAKDDTSTALKLKLHPFVFSKAKTQGKNFSIKKLITINNEILNIERQLKNGEKNPELLLDLFIAKNCS